MTKLIAQFLVLILASTVEAMTPARLLCASSLTVEPSQRTRESLPKLTVRGRVTNLGDKTIDPEIVGCQLLVNGKNSMSWNLAIANGPRDQREYALPPKETVEFSRVMGAGLFSEPGHYTLVLRVHDVGSRPAEVTFRGD